MLNRKMVCEKTDHEDLKTLSCNKCDAGDEWRRYVLPIV
jgi:hypothetical protein